MCNASGVMGLHRTSTSALGGNAKLIVVGSIRKITPHADMRATT